MYKFGKRSKKNIEQCELDLQYICYELISLMDVTVICGHRDEATQNKAYAEGKSQLKWPKSKHNSILSRAVDICPYPIDWNDVKRFERMCGMIEAIAKEKGIEIRLGRDFSFKDYPHIELV